MLQNSAKNAPKHVLRRNMKGDSTFLALQA